MGRSAIIGSIGSELVDIIFDLIKLRLQLRGIAGLLICQAMCNDLATVGINSQVQFASATPGPCPMLLFQPRRYVCAACWINHAIFDPRRIDAQR